MPSDPVAVAAEAQVKQRNETYALGVGLGVAAVVGGLVVIRFVKEAAEASAAARRPKEPWDL